ncbi:hypothetical protein [Nocardiopsis sp. FIRDI 009]|uniref:hypothetical protein n=1 Tax=Nocardiopsis sp. FIRDI 009 TaxID=714197 RepID=UPI000E247593|nr:hypothetical protein [Nocardiopsis sp. FIRDI 009]
MKRREQSQTEQLKQALAEREAQLQEARARLAAVEGSTSLQVGRALTAAAKKPGRSLVRLPRDLYRLWRRSGQTNHSQRRRPAHEPVRSFEAERQEARLLTGVVGGREDRLIAATVVGPAIQSAIDPYVRTVPLRPHDAQIVMDGVDVDLVLVSASAAAPGSPWAHVGDPAAADRTRALHWVLESAAARGIPAVLLDDAPAPPALRGLSFDRVHTGDAGVPLHLFNPVAADLAPGPAAVYVRAARDEPVPDVLADLGVRVVDADDADLPDALRAANVAVVPETSPDTDGLRRRAWACGARVVTHSPVPRPTGEDLAVSVPRLRAEQPTGSEQRELLRRVFLDEATPVRLSAVLEGLDFASGTSGADLPLRGRAVAVLADPAGEADADQLATDLLTARLRPAEVVVPGTAAKLAGVRRLRSEGVTVRTVRVSAPDTPEELTREADPAPGDTHGGLSPQRWAALAERAASPWAHPWTGPLGDHRLVDLVCAAECSGADAVGTADTGPATDDPFTGAGERGFFDRPDTGGQQYVFVSAIVPELARTELLRRGWRPREWNRRGSRLLALGPDHGSGPAPGGGGSSHSAAQTGAVG